jgi:hypothetical protein
MTSDEDIQRIAWAWRSLNNARRSRFIGKLTPDEKLKLKQAIRDAKRQPVINPSPSARSSNAV